MLSKLIGALALLAVTLFSTVPVEAHGYGRSYSPYDGCYNGGPCPLPHGGYGYYGRDYRYENSLNGALIGAAVSCLLFCPRTSTVVVIEREQGSVPQGSATEPCPWRPEYRTDANGRSLRAVPVWTPYTPGTGTRECHWSYQE